MQMTIKYMDCIIDCEFGYEDADHSVGYSGGVILETAYINGQNIYEMLADKHIAGIEEELFRRM